MTKGHTIWCNNITWCNHIIEKYVKVTKSEKHYKEEGCYHTYNTSSR